MQIYFLFMLVDMDNFFLAVMVYDSFVTICYPCLLYTSDAADDYLEV